MSVKANNFVQNKGNSRVIPSPQILGVRFQALRMNETLDLLESYIHDRQPRQITFSNAQTVTMCQSQKVFNNLINKSDLTLADGMSIVWGARWLGIHLPERVAGPDVMENLCALAAQKGYKVYLMGSSWENLRNLRSTLLQNWPKLNIVGFHSPPFCDRLSEKESNLIVEKINETNPDILFVGISSPKQEYWIAENLNKLKVPLALGVGAAFDFLSGKIPRAPEFLRTSGFEWLHRLWCEPRRLWKRYLWGNAVFLSLLLKEKIRRRISHSLNPSRN